MFSTMAAPSYVPTVSVQVFPFLHTLTNTCFRSFDGSHSDRFEVITHYGLGLHFYYD